MNPILSVNHVSYSYHTVDNETVALKDINFEIYPGSFTSIVGPSGCGKTTLLTLISGLIQPDSGNIYMNNLSANQARMHIGYMLQKDNLFEWISVYRNVLLGIEPCKQCTTNKIDLVNNMLVSYGLDPYKNVKPSQLTGGMQQRATLMKTLVLEPDLLLLDNPFSSFDNNIRLEVIDDLAHIVKEQNKTVILVTDDISEAIAMSEQIIVLSKQPATVTNVIDINLSIVNRTPSTTKTAPEFSTYMDTLLEIMKKA